MDAFNFQKMWENNPGIFLLIGFILFVGLIGKAKLFAKANLPMVAAFVPVWDVLVTLKMVGRPASHFFYLLIPGFNVYFAFKLLIEVAQSFGKNTVLDFILVTIFNVFYVLNLGLAYNEEYLGPVFQLGSKEIEQRRSMLAYE
jgi:hypothetical protein